MDPSDFSAGKLPKRELQGPRPTPLRVQKGSHKIRKPPVAPPQQQPLPQQHQRPQQPPQQHRPPVIIYTVSPKVIHADPSEFMTLVQRLTGSSSSVSSSSSSSSSLTNNTGSNSISPAARFASIEKTIKSPEKKSQMSSVVEGIELSKGLERTGFFPGILSPGPAALPTVPPNFFSPPSDPSPLNFFHDLSPLLRGNKNYIEGISFSPSPSNFLSPRIITSSSTPTLDVFNNFFDF